MDPRVKIYIKILVIGGSKVLELRPDTIKYFNQV